MKDMESVEDNADNHKTKNKNSKLVWSGRWPSAGRGRRAATLRWFVAAACIIGSTVACRGRTGGGQVGQAGQAAPFGESPGEPSGTSRVLRSEARYRAPVAPTPELIQARAQQRQLQGESSSVQALRQEVRRLEERPPPAETGEATGIKAKLAAVKRERDIEVQQVRRNECCSVCSRTKAQIEAGGSESFGAHLVSVSGTSQHCKADTLQSVQRRFAGTISALETKYQAALGNSTAEAERFRQELADARRRLATELQNHNRKREQQREALRRLEAQHEQANR